MIDSDLFADLGIPPDYGRNPRRPAYADATELEDVEPNIVGKMQRLAPPTARSWRQMKQAAALAGIELLLVSGFRSARQQAELFRQKLASGQDIGAILRMNAAPGFSEHHTGRAIDIATRGSRPLTVEFESSKAFAWLAANAVTFGFTMPYGRDNAFGFEFEPWHWSQLSLQSQRGAPIQV
ncbi:MAG TPA: M15 family metallopeptidase [Gammaproteobacteria bacterium]|jgi:D-alanyl-D-alanine carboxypeptidase|nr:M15 family metallopeptidase [Gammaproteobacteria bacterium]